MGPFCEPCANRFYRESSGGCIACGSGSLSPIAMATAILVGSGAALLAFRCVRHAKRNVSGARRKVEEKRKAAEETLTGGEGQLVRMAKLSKFAKRVQRKLGSKVQILIALFQVLGSVGLVFAMPFPSLYKRILAWFSIFELNIFAILPLSCSMPGVSPFFITLLLRTALPVLLVACLLLAAMLLRWRSMHQLSGSIMQAVSLLIFLMYPGATATLFTTFVCENLDAPGGQERSFLRVDYTVDCEGSLYVQLLQPYAVLMSMLSPVGPVGTPLLYFFVLWYNRKQLLALREQERFATIKLEVKHAHSLGRAK